MTVNPNSTVTWAARLVYVLLGVSALLLAVIESSGGWLSAACGWGAAFIWTFRGPPPS